MLQRELVAGISARLGGAGADKRAAALPTPIAGLVVPRCILRLEPIASMPPG